MGRRILYRDALVGYDPKVKQLIVSLSNKMAKQMFEDGWTIHEVAGAPLFITIDLVEDEK